MLVAQWAATEADVKQFISSGKSPLVPLGRRLLIGTGAAGTAGWAWEDLRAFAEPELTTTISILANAQKNKVN